MTNAEIAPLTPLQIELLKISDAAPNYRTAVQWVKDYFDGHDSHFSLVRCEMLLVRAKSARLRLQVIT
jgi:hypothetical protein